MIERVRYKGVASRARRMNLYLRKMGSEKGTVIGEGKFRSNMKGKARISSSINQQLNKECT